MREYIIMDSPKEELYVGMVWLRCLLSIRRNAANNIRSRVTMITEEIK